MSFVDSPRIEYDVEGAPPERGRGRRLFLRVLIVALLLVAIIVNVFAWTEGNVINRLAGTNGEIQGQVLTASGEPLAGAQVFLDLAPGTIVLTDAQGFFDLRNVPTGQQTLIVGYNERGEEFLVQVSKESATQVGKVIFVTPIADDYWK